MRRGTQGARDSEKPGSVEWWKQVRSDNPRVQEIVKRLWQIGETISELHDEKQRCREDDSGDDSDEYLEFGAEHCDRCAKMTQTQERLRGERESLFTALEDACGKEQGDHPACQKILQRGTTGERATSKRKRAGRGRDESWQ